jgi:hypothetical protein
MGEMTMNISDHNLAIAEAVREACALEAFRAMGPETIWANGTAVAKMIRGIDLTNVIASAPTSVVVSDVDDVMDKVVLFACAWGIINHPRHGGEAQLERALVIKEELRDMLTDNNQSDCKRTLEIVEVDDNTFYLRVGEKVSRSFNHVEYGWDGMYAARNAALFVCEAMGIDVEDITQ